MKHVHTSYFTSQDNVSHPDSERELMLWSGFGVETGEFGDQLVRSIDRYLRISPLWPFAVGIRMAFHPA
jgi:hypothetical protein